MNTKRIDLSKCVHALCQEYPELVAIMSELGFTEVAKPAKLNTVGRMITLPKGARMMGIDMERIKGVLAGHGFEVTGEENI